MKRRQVKPLADPLVFHLETHHRREQLFSQQLKVNYS